MKIIKDREKAERLARAIVFDLRFCHQDRVKEGRARGDLLEVMAEEIARGLERLTSRVSRELDPEGIYHQAVEELLVRSPEEVQHEAGPEEKVHCCPRCRLIQPPAGECTYCHKGAPIAVGSIRWASIMRREARGKEDPGVGPYVLLLLVVVTLQSVGLLWLLPDLVGAVATAVLLAISLAASFLGFLRILTRVKLPALGVQGSEPRRFLPGRVSPGAKVVRGVAWRLSDTTSTYLDNEECLAAALLFYEKTPENLTYWSMRRADFLVESEDDHQVLIREGFWLDPRGGARLTGEVPGTKAKGVLKSLGVNHLGPFEVPGHELAIREGDTVEVHGEIRQMAVPELAGRQGLRGGGHALVLVGGPDAPVVVRVAGD